MGNIKTLLLLTAGDIFGEITVLQQDQDKVSTCAITDTTLEKITAATFFSLLGQSPAAYEAIMYTHSYIHYALQYLLSIVIIHG